MKKNIDIGNKHERLIKQIIKSCIESQGCDGLKNPELNCHCSKDKINTSCFMKSSNCQFAFSSWEEYSIAPRERRMPFLFYALKLFKSMQDEINDLKNQIKKLSKNSK